MGKVGDYIKTVRGVGIELIKLIRRTFVYKNIYNYSMLIDYCWKSVMEWLHWGCHGAIF